MSKEAKLIDGVLNKFFSDEIKVIGVERIQLMIDHRIKKDENLSFKNLNRGGRNFDYSELTDIVSDVIDFAKLFFDMYKFKKNRSSLVEDLKSKFESLEEDEKNNIINFILDKIDDIEDE